MALKTMTTTSPHKSSLKNEVDGNAYTAPVIAKLSSDSVGGSKQSTTGNVNDAPLTLKTDSAGSNLKG